MTPPLWLRLPRSELKRDPVIKKQQKHLANILNKAFCFQCSGLRSGTVKTSQIHLLTPFPQAARVLTRFPRVVRVLRGRNLEKHERNEQEQEIPGSWRPAHSTESIFKNHSPVLSLYTLS